MNGSAILDEHPCAACHAWFGNEENDWFRPAVCIRRRVICWDPHFYHSQQLVSSFTNHKFLSQKLIS